MTEIKIRAEKRAGELLKTEVKAGNPQLLQTATIGLKELGIEKTQSHRWQKMASLPEKKFEEYIAETKKTQKKYPKKQPGPPPIRTTYYVITLSFWRNAVFCISSLRHRSGVIPHSASV